MHQTILYCTSDDNRSAGRPILPNDSNGDVHSDMFAYMPWWMCYGACACRGGANIGLVAVQWVQVQDVKFEWKMDYAIC
jgi:hypothetical protein